MIKCDTLSMIIVENIEMNVASACGPGKKRGLFSFLPVHLSIKLKAEVE